MVQNICGSKTPEKNRNKAGVTISDGCDGIWYISADSKNTVTTVTGKEKRPVRRWGDLEYIQEGMWGVGGQPSRQLEIFVAVRQIFHRLDFVSKPPAGRKTRLRVAFLMGLPVKNAFALLLTKVTKHIPPQTSPVGSSLAGI